MKNIISIFLIALSLYASAQVKTPSPSPAGSVTTVVGLTDVKIEYSRPRAKGRKIFGDGSALVPYGSIWRTGANNGTVISFSDDVSIEGTKVPAGKYLVFTWPGASEWTVTLYTDLELGGNTDKYDKTKEAANFKVKSEKLAEKIETLTFNIGDISDDSKTAKVQLAWENTSVKFSIAVDFDAKVMESISNNTGGGAFYQAASYYFESGKDNKQALDWATIATTANKNAYWAWLLKAKIQKAMGDKKGALESSNTSKTVAQSGPNPNPDYVKQNDEFQKTLK